MARTRARRLASLAAAVALTLAAIACAGPPTLAPSGTVTLAPGDTVRVGQTSWKLRFDGARNDSRCAIGVLCVRAGDVTLDFTALGPGAAASTLSARFGEGDAAVTVGGQRLEITDVRPQPVAGHTIPPGDYRVTLAWR